MMRRTPFKRSAARAAPAQDRDQRLLERAARMAAQACPRSAVVATVTGMAPPVHKDNPLRSEAFRRAVAGLACAHCGIQGYSQHAHSNEGKGVGLKTDDRTGFPLCCTRPGIEGCHVAFDQYRLLPGGREAHRAAARTWAANTRAEIQRLGQWPARLPLWTEGNPA